MLTQYVPYRILSRVRGSLSRQESRIDARKNCTMVNPHIDELPARRCGCEYRATPYVFGTMLALALLWIALVTEQKPILIVEDEPDAREALREFLQTYGFTVVCADNGQDAG